MITVDANVTIVAINYHLTKRYKASLPEGVRKDKLYIACARIMAKRNKKVIGIPELFALEVLVGAKSDREAQIITRYFQSIKVIASTKVDARVTVSVLRMLKRAKRHRTDMLGYVTGSRAKTECHITNDKKMSDPTQIPAIKEAVLKAGLDYAADIAKPTDDLGKIMKNPHTPIDGSKELRRMIASHRARGQKVIRDTCGDSIEAQLSFSRSLLSAVGIKVVRA